MANRKSTTEEIEAEILIKSKRRCAICFGLNNDLREKRGQISHIDNNSSNSKENNLVFLCLNHHDEYDSKTSQSKGITKKELTHYKNELLKKISKEKIHYCKEFSKQLNQTKQKYSRFKQEILDCANDNLEAIADSIDSYIVNLEKKGFFDSIQDFPLPLNNQLKDNQLLNHNKILDIKNRFRDRKLHDSDVNKNFEIAKNQIITFLDDKTSEVTDRIEGNEDMK